MKKTPKLRFKEFSGDWESKKLSELSKLSSGGTPSRSKKEYWDGDIPWITTGEINFNCITKSKENITEEGLKNSSAKLFPKNTILIAMYGQGMTRGKCAILGIDATTNQACAAILPSMENSQTFIYHYLSKEYDNIRASSNEGSQRNLSLGLLGEIEITKPKLEEQEKIAYLFSLIDNKISLQSEKVEALKDYKKGIMQKIFSRELRFKDDEGRDYPKWRNIELKEMLELIIDNRGKTPPISKEGIPLLEVASLGYMYPDFSKITKYVDKETYNDWFRNHIQEGDLLFTTVGATGLVSLVNSIKSCIAQNIVGFRFKQGYNSEFIYNLFSYSKTKKKIKSIEMGAVQPSIKVTQLIKLKFLVPSLEEQIKIGKILSSIDNKIEKEQEKLDSLNEYKKGLLQQMFI